MKEKSLMSCIYICSSGERWVITNHEEPLGTTEIGPAVSRGTRRLGNSVPDCTRIKLSPQSVT